MRETNKNFDPFYILGTPFYNDAYETAWFYFQILDYNIIPFDDVDIFGGDPVYNVLTENGWEYAYLGDVISYDGKTLSIERGHIWS